MIGASAIIWCAILSVTWIQRRIGQRIGRWIYLPGVIGVPVHEISHAVIALLMGHKINKVSLFNPQQDGTLGYVEHSFKANATAPYRNLLIAIAPFFGGGLAFYWLTKWLMPSVAITIYDGFSYAQSSMDVIRIAGAVVIDAYQAQWDIEFWMWVIAGCSILLFCIPSTADFAGTQKALVITGVIIITAGLISPKVGSAVIGGIYHTSVMMLPWVVAINLVMIGLLAFVLLLKSFITAPKGREGI
jgi:hypothetical protein